MDLFLVIALLALGLFFIFLEIFFVPGTTVVGIVGLILVGAGIYQVYDIFGPTAGHLTTGISVFVLTAAIIVGFKAGAWERFSSKSTITAVPMFGRKTL